MTTRKTVKPSRGRVPNDPLDWVDGVGQTDSEETPAVTQQVAEKRENVSAAPVQKQTLIERKQEKTMSEVKNVEQSDRCVAIGEIRRVAEAVKKGNLEVRADASGLKGECAEVAQAINEMVAWFSQQQQQFDDFTNDMLHMSSEHDKGDIDVTIDATKFKGGFADIATGVNAMVLGHIAVKKKAMACLKAFAEGDFNAELEMFPGKKVFINETIESMRVNLRALVADAGMLSVAAVQGKLATRADATKHQGDFRKIVEGVNETLDAVIGPLNVAADYVDNISKGAIPAKITDTYNGDFNILKNNLNTCVDAVNALVADAVMLSVAAVQGKLATRADATKHQGDFRKIVEGVNETLDAVIGPLNVAADYVDNISKGAIPAKITDTYNGDFNILKNNLNTCVDAVNDLVADAVMLSVAAVQGKLATRADATKHQGDFRKIVEGVNETLDAVIGPLNNISNVIEALGNNDLSAKLEGEYKGDFLRIINTFDNAMMRMNEAFYQITDATEQVNQSADSLNASSQIMAATSEEQSASVEEVTASLEETDSQVKANTDNANAANQLVMDTSQAANQGQAKMAGMIDAMDAINQSSQDIAKIIKVIDEIAFQTNLLALNAAVEAARAGQHGRGFAVVAQEVRNLAGRSAKAARETADLIEHSSKRVNEGVGIANETREALDQIVGNVIKVKDLVAEIATASTEQSRGVSQINLAMNQVAKAAQDGKYL